MLQTWSSKPHERLMFGNVIRFFCAMVLADSHSRVLFEEPVICTRCSLDSSEPSHCTIIEWLYLLPADSISHQHQPSQRDQHEWNAGALDVCVPLQPDQLQRDKRGSYTNSGKSN